MQIGRYQFKPTISVTLISLLVFVVLSSLGVWQLNRAEHKLATQTAMLTNLEQHELEILLPLENNLEYRFRHARLQGYFDIEHQYLLDNKIEKGRPGFLVITPFVYATGKAVILVNRGWLPLGATRQDIPDVTLTATQRRISGILSDLPGKLPSFGINATVVDGSWPRVIRDVEIEQISLDLGYTVPPYLLHLAQQDKAAYAQNWQPVASGPEKNRSYAIQWFAMALVILILFIGLNSRRSEE